MSFQSAIIGLCTLGMLALVPPLAWHTKTKNTPAVILIMWLILMDFKCIVNAAIWSGSDFMMKWEGKGWCDIVIKLEVGANVGISCAVTNIIYNLHKILKADNALLKHNSWRKIAQDLSISLLTPIMVMALSYLVQVFRFGIARYYGCLNILSPTWVTTVVYTMWLLIWSSIGAIYAVLVLIVYYRKRKDVKDILYCTNSGLNITRFARLLIFCFLIILVMFPFSIYLFVKDLRQVGTKFSFRATHSKEFWGTILKFDVGHKFVNVWIYVLMSYLVFLIFGLGTDALDMYASFMRLIGLGFTLDKFSAKRDEKNNNRFSAFMESIILHQNSDMQQKYSESLTPTSQDCTFDCEMGNFKDAMFSNKPYHINVKKSYVLNDCVLEKIPQGQYLLSDLYSYDDQITFHQHSANSLGSLGHVYSISYRSEVNSANTNKGIDTEGSSNGSPITRVESG
ncbi:STE3 [Nakaseomyces glabratus]|nr:STE3 [Nakaseomyces glabratus]UCS28929.1 STE3 [Nakaseomyces glabratus]UCS34158.1 STE3 [Nakaseomyces glabratus]UCS39388.1 STE3 [Nakaseomyces glabratus]